MHHASATSVLGIKGSSLVKKVSRAGEIKKRMGIIPGGEFWFSFLGLRLRGRHMKEARSYSTVVCVSDGGFWKTVPYNSVIQTGRKVV